MSAPEVQVKSRDERGRFVKGQSGNPAGRRAGAPTFTGLLRTRVSERPDLVDKLVELAGSEDERVALQALIAIANRLDGMPKQAIEQQVTTTEKWEQVQQVGSERLRQVK